MTQEHPITPPPELIRKWNEEAANAPMADQRYIATQAARWGADQELKACCDWLSDGWGLPAASDNLCAARRPKPPSLKERALKILEEEPEADDMKELIVFDTAQVEIIRRALEALPE